MSRLIAQRPVLYQGRNYRQGDALPANDATMVEAWLKAGSARWLEPAREPAPLEAGGEGRRDAERQAAEVLAGLGVEIVDGEGHFVGEKLLKDQLCFAVQDLLPDYEDVLPVETLSGGALPEDPDAHIAEVGLDGHFSKEDLMQLSKAELLDLAADLKADVRKCKTKTDLADVLAAMDAETALNGQGPPEEPV